VLLDVGGDEFFIDLLFYHLKLRCYVVIELKGGKFKPEHLGQLGFYMTAIDRLGIRSKGLEKIDLTSFNPKKNPAPSLDSYFVIPVREVNHVLL
jgi:hypothetical protein